MDPADLVRSALLLRDRFGQRRSDGRPLFLPRPRFFFVIQGSRYAGRSRLNLVEKLPGSEPPDLLRVEDFAGQQRFGNLDKHLLLAGEEPMRTMIVGGDEAVPL